MLDQILSYLLINTYEVLFLVSFSAALILPLPASAVMMAAWAFASQWFVDFSYVAASSYFGCLVWDVSWYLISLKLGRSFFEKVWLSWMLISKRFLWVESAFLKNESKSIFFSRFPFTWLWSIVNILSWLSSVTAKKFLILNIIWEALHVFVFVCAWYILSDSWQILSSMIEYVLWILALLIVLVFSIRYVLSKRRLH